MRYKTHLAGGVLAGALVLKAYPEIDIYSLKTLGILGLASLGSLLPDLDIKGSYISNRLKISSYILRKFSNHRGLSHTPIAAILFSLFIALISNKLFSFTIPIIYLLALFSGIMSHILLDALTKQGVPLLAPLTKKKISFTKFATGSKFETFVNFILMLSSIAVAINIIKA